MRFLIFNIVVALALIQLFAGDSTKIRAFVGQSVDKVATIIEDTPDAQEDEMAPSFEPPVVKQPTATAKEAAALTPRPLPKLPEVTVAKRDPKPAPRPEPQIIPAPEPRVDTPPIAEATPIHQPEEITPLDEARPDRRQALMRLAEEMELFAAGQAGQ